MRRPAFVGLGHERGDVELDPVRGQLAHDLVFKVPGLRTLVQQYGTVPASPQNMRRALESDAALLVYPGGDEESFRPSWESSEIDFAVFPFQRTVTAPHDEHVRATSEIDRAFTDDRVSEAPLAVPVDSVPANAPEAPCFRLNDLALNEPSSSGTPVQRSTDQLDVFPALSRARADRHTVFPTDAV